MIKKIKKAINTTGLLVLFLMIGCVTGQPARQTVVDQKMIKKINNAVFEVVIPKPVKDSLTYEKELPMHLVPFAIRNDKFYSIGTAFAIGENRFLSAAHVVKLNVRSQFEKYYLRDSKGKTYEINKIYKYSNYHDFIEFSVKGTTKVKEPFTISTKIEMNKQVFAIGNAFGEGIITRNGILTSQTSEDEEGAWKWLRFSAAASPGNSGGPSLDSAGKVIGIVVRKSKNENLNYALPITEVKKFKNLTALDHQRYNYRLLNTERKKRFKYDYTAKLPKHYNALKNEFVKKEKEYDDFMYKDFLTSFKKNIFPNGKGAIKLLHSSISSQFPELICEDKNGEWASYYPKNKKSEDLDNNGFIQAGSMGSVSFIRTKNPDNVKMEYMLKNPKALLDQFLKAYPSKRSIMKDETRILSFGKPQKNSIHIDKNKRKWIVSIWYTEFNDSKLIMFTLPVPAGSLSMLVQVPTDSNYMTDLKYLTDFVHFSYGGTFKQWDEFLKLKKYIPEIFHNQSFAYETDVKASYKSKRFSFNYQKKLQNISDNSILALNFGYFNENNSVKWDVTEIVVLEDKARQTGFFISKIQKPDKRLNEEYHNSWKKYITNEHPYNSTSYFEESKTVINSIYKPKAAKDQYLYIIGYSYPGKHAESVMKNKISMTKSIFKVK